MRIQSLRAYIAIAALVTGGCVDATPLNEEGEYDDEVVELDESTEKFLQSDNGLQTWNGLLASNGLLGRNGLKALNGLSTRNGLRLRNGVPVMNGLATRNGWRTFNGLSVNCAGASRCTADPDGLLNSTTGLLSSDDGIHFAKYLVRCALPAQTEIRVRNYRGYLESLKGQIGLAPEWLDQQCDTACEEKVSGCLLALTNRRGNHISLEMTSTAPSIGTGRSGQYSYQEAAFFGNLFTSPPVAHLAMGVDLGLGALGRSCDADGSNLICPVGPVGTIPDKCQQTNVVGGRGTATVCRSRTSVSSRSWSYPMTTWRSEFSYGFTPGVKFTFPSY